MKRTAYRRKHNLTHKRNVNFFQTKNSSIFNNPTHYTHYTCRFIEFKKQKKNKKTLTFAIFFNLFHHEYCKCTQTTILNNKMTESHWMRPNVKSMCSPANSNRWRHMQNFLFGRWFYTSIIRSCVYKFKSTMDNINTFFGTNYQVICPRWFPITSKMVFSKFQLVNFYDFPQRLFN